MRANFNPRRMKAIEKAGTKLIEALASLCPNCKTPGFSVSKPIAGPPCEESGIPTCITKDVIWSCVKCSYTEQKERPDGLRKISESNCEFCKL